MTAREDCPASATLAVFLLWVLWGSPATGHWSTVARAVKLQPELQCIFFFVFFNKRIYSCHTPPPTLAYGAYLQSFDTTTTLMKLFLLVIVFKS